MPRNKIKHNDMLPWFTQDHGTLPKAYLKSCREFFDWLDRCDREGFQAPSSKRQATSSTQLTGISKHENK